MLESENVQLCTPLEETVSRYTSLIQKELHIRDKCVEMARAYASGTKKQRQQVSQQLASTTEKLVTVIRESLSHLSSAVPTPPPKTSRETIEGLDSTTTLTQRFKRNSLYAQSITASQSQDELGQLNFHSIHSFSEHRLSKRSSLSSMISGSMNSDVVQGIQRERDLAMSLYQKERQSNLVLQQQVSMLQAGCSLQVSSPNNTIDTQTTVQPSKGLEHEDLFTQTIAEDTPLSLFRPTDSLQEVKILKHSATVMQERILDLEHMLRAVNVDKYALSFAEKYTRARLRLDQLENHKAESKATSYLPVYEGILSQLGTLKSALVRHKEDSLDRIEVLNAELQVVSADRDSQIKNVELKSDELAALSSQSQVYEAKAHDAVRLTSTLRIVEQELVEAEALVEKLQAIIAGHAAIVSTYDSHLAQLAKEYADAIISIQGEHQATKNQLNDSSTNIEQLKSQLVSLEALSTKHLIEQQSLFESSAEAQEATHQSASTVQADQLFLAKEHLTLSNTHYASIILQKEDQIRTLNDTLLSHTLTNAQKQPPSLSDTSLTSYKETIHTNLELIASLQSKFKEAMERAEGLDSIVQSQDESIETLLAKLNAQSLSATASDAGQDQTIKLQRSEIDTLKNRLGRFLDAHHSIDASRNKISGIIRSLNSFGNTHSQDTGESDALKMVEGLQDRISGLGRDMMVRVDALFKEYEAVLNLQGTLV